MRLSVRALQKIFLSIVFLWFILLFKNVSDLPTVGDDEGDYPSIPLLQQQQQQQQLLVHNTENNDMNLVGRRQERKETFRRIYGNDNRIRDVNTNTNTNATTRRKRRRFRPGSTGLRDIIVTSNDPIGNENRDHQFNVTTNETSSKNNYNRFEVDDDSSSPRKREREREKPTLLLPTPIIVMGFPKAGTSSIFSFFQRQGLVSQHWYCCEG